jgi:hypothetical protein
MDKFDLKKFLKESKALENLNPTLKSINESYDDDLKAKIREMIVAELEGDEIKEETDVDLTDPLFEDELEEAKKKKDEKVEDIDVTDTEDISTEDLPADEEAPVEDAPEAAGGLEDIAADMKGTEADLMDHLMKAFQIAKGMNNEKLETQVGNTLKFFVSEYIGGGQD